MKETEHLRVTSPWTDRPWIWIAAFFVVVVALPCSYGSEAPLALASSAWRVTPIEKQAPWTGFVCELRKNG